MGYDEKRAMLRYLVATHVKPDPIVGIGPAYAEAIDTLQKQSLGSKQSRTGQIFEWLLSASLDELGLGYQTGVKDYEDIEVDFRIHLPRIHIHCKTSARERWAQADRTEMVYKHYLAAKMQPSVSILLIGNEHPSGVERKSRGRKWSEPWTAAKQSEQCRSIARKCRAISRVMTSMSPSDMEGLRCLLMP